MTQATAHVANRPAGGVRRARRTAPRNRAPGDRRESLADRMTSPVFVALDMTDLDSAKALAARIKTHVGGLKLGSNSSRPTAPTACARWPRSACRSSSTSSCTTSRTPSPRPCSAAPLEPAILTVHAAGGRAMMEDAKAAAPSGTKVVAVTVLTSLDEADLAAIGVAGMPTTRSCG